MQSSLSGGGSVELTLLHNRLASVCREMGSAMMKTAYSPVFSEGFDFVCALFDRDGRMIAQAEYNPSMLGAAHFTVDWVVQEIGAGSFQPGDVIIHNDPYRGGCHLPEHALVKPVFHNRTLFGFAAVIGHVAEIGGKAVGGLPGDATDVYQEGLRLPPVRLMERGERAQDVWRILLTNHRTPRVTWGDLHAMLGALDIGEARLGNVLAERGAEETLRDCEELIKRSERFMRAEIATIPDGEYAFADWMENDGITDQPYLINVVVAVRNDEIIADFTGSSPQARGPINATYAVTAAATYNAVFHLTDPNVPRNAGCNRPITVIAPPGTIVNVTHPAPEVGGNSETHCRIIGVVMGALAQALPHRAAAADGASGCNFLFGGVHPDTGSFYANYHFENVGWEHRLSMTGTTPSARRSPSAGTPRSKCSRPDIPSCTDPSGSPSTAAEPADTAAGSERSASSRLVLTRSPSVRSSTGRRYHRGRSKAVARAGRRRSLSRFPAPTAFSSSRSISALFRPRSSRTRRFVPAT